MILGWFNSTSKNWAKVGTMTIEQSRMSSGWFNTSESLQWFLPFLQYAGFKLCNLCITLFVQ